MFAEKALICETISNPSRSLKLAGVMTIFPGAPAANAASQKKKNTHSKSARNVGTGGFDLPEKFHPILIRKHRDGQAIKIRLSLAKRKLLHSRLL